MGVETVAVVVVIVVVVVEMPGEGEDEDGVPQETPEVAEIAISETILAVMLRKVGAGDAGAEAAVGVAGMT